MERVKGIEPSYQFLYMCRHFGVIHLRNITFRALRGPVVNHGFASSKAVKGVGKLAWWNVLWIHSVRTVPHINPVARRWAGARFKRLAEDVFEAHVRLKSAHGDWSKIRPTNRTT